MAEEQAKGDPCLWRALDGRCANCKARRYRIDALGMRENYGECCGQADYRTCVFYKPKPVSRS